MAILEVIAFDAEAAVKAAAAGAHRLELCDNAAVGGTTPSLGFVKFCMDHLSIPCFPMVRPRGGNFVYTATEIEVMKSDIAAFKNIGCKGIVLGLLDEKGEVAFEDLQLLVQLAFPMEVTFHRAFDRTVNFLHALEKIVEAGCSRILSSGQRATAIEGEEILKKIIEVAGNRIIIMPGSGIRSSNISALHDNLQAAEYHTSASLMAEEPQGYSNNFLNDNQMRLSVDEVEIKNIISFIA